MCIPHQVITISDDTLHLQYDAKHDKLPTGMIPGVNMYDDSVHSSLFAVRCHLLTSYSRKCTLLSCWTCEFAGHVSLFLSLKCVYEAGRDEQQGMDGNHTGQQALDAAMPELDAVVCESSS